MIRPRHLTHHCVDIGEPRRHVEAPEPLPQHQPVKEPATTPAEPERVPA